ncbi:MAG: site-2 protease family protein [Terracidiphilus sp.]|nr:site-2 protease family protein [Terracidiphilus sp.]
MQSSAFLIAVFEFVLLIFSLSFHECAHAWMASRLGDQTARLQGRVTLNPMYHVDPIGTLLFPALVIFGPFIGFHLPLMLVGWAKPTPVITRNFRKIVRDDNLVSLAGPASNLLLAVVATVVLLVFARLIPGGATAALQSFLLSVGEDTSAGAHPVAVLASLAIVINLSLLFFNLLPIPPLDGSRVVRNLLPYNAATAYDRVSGWISYLLMIFVGGYVLNLAVSPLLGFVFRLLLRMQPAQQMILQ